MKFALKKKRPYIPPSASKCALEQAKQFVASHIKGNEEKAADLIESMRQEQQESEK
jgi:hypothetical protein